MQGLEVKSSVQPAFSAASSMYKLVVLLAFASLAAAQHQQYNGQPQNAAILSEQRYLSGDGTFGASYTQEDGVDFKEESDAEGNRRGSYSYVDPTGQRRTVSYTAGKNGFQATGDHLPQAPAPVAPQPQYQPQQQYNPAPQQYQAQQYQQPQQQYQPQQYQQPQQQYQQQQYQAPQQYTTTPSPHRFFPPGKLNLNRTPDGFSYSFNKA